MTRDFLDQILDAGWSEADAKLRSKNPLRFPAYDPINESVIVASGAIGSFPVEAISFNFEAFGGSMGIVAGEKIARSFERAVDRRAAVVALCASGGARMQEGMLSLAQMAKTVVARTLLEQAGLPFIAYLQNPTTGGVYASFASLADLIWAEPNATIGFAGPRVAEQVTGSPLPTGSHTAEFALEHGLIDAITPRVGLAGELLNALDLIRGADTPSESPPPLEPKQSADPWSYVQAARDVNRPTAQQICSSIATPHTRIGSPFVEGIACAITRILGRRVVIIAMDRARPTPLAYRKARRAISLASRFSLPIVSLIDTPGADPSSESEAGGIAREIASTFHAMLSAPVPTVSVITGEGGSGGALALACTDRVLISENAIFSVIAPEGAASILKRNDVERVAAELQLTSFDLKRFGIADAIVPEKDGIEIEQAIGWALSSIDPTNALQSRRTRWRELGNAWLEE
ncbi:MAG: carboxyl transferase domain-containing protein [Actinomycetota bacterium]